MAKSKSKTKKNRSIQSLRVIPVKSGVRDFNNLVEFYLYTAPLIDSALSRGGMAEEEQEEKMEKILRVSGLSTECFLKKIRSESFEKRGLEVDTIDFTESVMLCGKMTNETNLHALLRHIRNSIAHGNVSIYNGMYVCLDDYDSSKNGGKHSARIVVDINFLKAWKQIIIEQLEEQADEFASF